MCCFLRVAEFEKTSSFENWAYMWLLAEHPNSEDIK